MRTPLQTLKAFADGYPTRNQAARALRISPTQLAELIKGRRTFSDRLLKRLGFERIIVKREDAGAAA